MDIERLEMLPTKANKHEFHGNQYGDHWYNSWSAQTAYLNKVRLDKFVGWHVNDVVARYLPRLPKDAFTWRAKNRVKVLLYILDLKLPVRGKDGHLYIDEYYGVWSRLDLKKPSWKGQAPIFYIMPETGVIHVKRFSFPTESKRKRAIRLRKEAEKEKSLAKMDRDKKRRLEEEKDERYWQWIMTRKAEAEKRLSEQKMVAKGFDPKTSFRNVPTN